MRRALVAERIFAVFAVAVPTSSSKPTAAQNRVTCGVTIGFAALANGQAGAQFAKTCRAVTGAKPLRARIVHSKTTTEATALTCRFARAVQFDGSVTATGPRVQVIEPAAKVSGTVVPAATSVLIAFTATGGALYYNSAECQPAPPPSG